MGEVPGSIPGTALVFMGGGNANQMGPKAVLNEEGAARLAQLVERKALNLVVVGSSPTVGAFFPPMHRWAT